MVGHDLIANFHHFQGKLLGVAPGHGMPFAFTNACMHVWPAYLEDYILVTVADLCQCIEQSLQTLGASFCVAS